MAKNCWELRGCYKDEEMNAGCVHNIPGEPCPAECKFSECNRPSHVVARDVTLLLNPDLNYDASVKEVCRTCENFLTNGPVWQEGEEHIAHRQGNPNRFLF